VAHPESAFPEFRTPGGGKSLGKYSPVGAGVFPLTTSPVPIPRGLARGIDTRPLRPPNPRTPERRGGGERAKDSGQVSPARYAAVFRAAPATRPRTARSSPTAPTAAATTRISPPSGAGPPAAAQSAVSSQGSPTDSAAAARRRGRLTGPAACEHYGAPRSPWRLGAPSSPRGQRRRAGRGAPRRRMAGASWSRRCPSRKTAARSRRSATDAATKELHVAAPRSHQAGRTHPARRADGPASRPTSRRLQNRSLTSAALLSGRAGDPTGVTAPRHHRHRDAGGHTPDRHRPSRP